MNVTPKTHTQVLPLQIAEALTGDAEPRTWLLPLMRRHVRHARLGFWFKVRLCRGVQRGGWGCVWSVFGCALGVFGGVMDVFGVSCFSLPKCVDAVLYATSRSQGLIKHIALHHAHLHKHTNTFVHTARSRFLRNHAVSQANTREHKHTNTQTRNNTHKHAQELMPLAQQLGARAAALSAAGGAAAGGLALKCRTLELQVGGEGVYLLLRVCICVVHAPFVYVCSCVTVHHIGFRGSVRRCPNHVKFYSRSARLSHECRVPNSHPSASCTTFPNILATPPYQTRTTHIPNPTQPINTSTPTLNPTPTPPTPPTPHTSRSGTASPPSCRGPWTYPPHTPAASTPSPPPSPTAPTCNPQSARPWRVPACRCVVCVCGLCSCVCLMCVFVLVLLCLCLVLVCLCLLCVAWLFDLCVIAQS